MEIYVVMKISSLRRRSLWKLMAVLQRKNETGAVSEWQNTKRLG